MLKIYNKNAMNYCTSKYPRQRGVTWGNSQGHNQKDYSKYHSLIFSTQLSFLSYAPPFFPSCLPIWFNFQFYWFQ
jgi:hypothetical protein